MPFKKMNVVVEAAVPVPAGDVGPEHPIYIPITPPPDSGLSPEHPIYIPVEPPLGTWGGVAPPHVDISPPGAQPGPDQGLPGDQPRPDQGLPGAQPGPSHPIYIPITPPPDSGLAPEHPIYIPVEIWGDIELPTHPIQLPPTDLTDDQKQKLRDFIFGNLPPSAGPV
jgi:hypothetical protein